MTDEAKQEFTRRITNANKSELVVILFEMFDVYVKDAIKLYDAGDLAGMTAETGKARNVVRELINTLDRKYEVADNLYNIYRYVDRLLIDAEVRRKSDTLPEAAKHMAALGETFKSVASKDTDKPIMENAEPVYAGMTYGAAGVNETGSGTGRGFLA